MTHTGFNLHLGAIGAPMVKVMVFDSDDAVKIFTQYRDSGPFGSSEMLKGCGNVTDLTGKLVCRISYNGRVWLPNGQPLDGVAEGVVDCSKPGLHGTAVLTLTSPSSGLESTGDDRQQP
jgi:hypothetical protein